MILPFNDGFRNYAPFKWDDKKNVKITRKTLFIYINANRISKKDFKIPKNHENMCTYRCSWYWVQMLSGATGHRFNCISPLYRHQSAVHDIKHTPTPKTKNENRRPSLLFVTPECSNPLPDEVPDLNAHDAEDTRSKVCEDDHDSKKDNITMNNISDCLRDLIDPYKHDEQKGALKHRDEFLELLKEEDRVVKESTLK